MKYSEDEKKCIRIIAKWFRENKTVVKRKEAIKELGVDGDKYDTLIRMMRHNGIVENIDSVMGKNGYAVAFRPSPYAEELARELGEEDERSNEGKAFTGMSWEKLKQDNEAAQQVKNEGVFAENEEIKLKEDFKKFLEGKGYSDSFEEIAKKGPQIELCVVDRDTSKPIAIFEFKLTNDDKTLFNATRQLISFCNEGILGKPDPFMYIICSSHTKSSEPFEICKVSDNGYESILINDFPKYEDLIRRLEIKTEVSGGKGGDDKNVADFKSKLTDIGKELLGKLIELIRSEPSFSIKVASSNYINIRVKTPNRVALQIHRVADDRSQLGLAIAGWDEDDPEIKNKYAIVRRDIKRLSGLHDTTQENFWLRGKIQSQAKRSFPPYEAKVYIIDPGILQFDEVWEELRELLRFAKESTEKGSAVDEPLEEEGEVDFQKMASAGMSVADHAWGDRVAHKDNLGFRPYVEVVARFLTHEETELPLTLSVEGEWGSGKSSFLSQLKDEIGRIYKDKGQEKAFIVEFDPWRHDKDEALWAAFALKFIGDASKCLTMRKRWRANWELWKQRFQWRQAWPDLLRIVLVGLAWVLATVGICIGLWNGIQLGETGTVVLPKWIGSIVALIVSLWAVLGKVKDFLGSPLAVDLKKYMRRLDYVSKVSFIEKFHDDFKKIVSAYAEKERVYVFIDDLDRCNVPKAAELMESINLMILENPKLVFVMGMDREKVAAGLAVKHEKLLPYLAGQTEKKEVDKDEAKRLRGVRYGYSFIEKFVQVSFILPQPDEKCIEEMLMGMSGQLKQEVPPDEHIGETPETRKADVRQTKMEEEKELESREYDIRQKQIKEEFLKFDGDDPTFRAIVLMVSKAFDYNPRRAKQFVNIFRLRAATAKVTGLYEPKDGKRLTFEQLGKFVGIGLGWPLLIRDIERRPALLEELVEEAEGRTEGEANEKKKPKANGLYFERWSDNEKLMELLKAGCENEKDAEKCRSFSLKGLDVKKLLQVAPRVMSVEEEMV